MSSDTQGHVTNLLIMDYDDHDFERADFYRRLMREQQFDRIPVVKHWHAATPGEQLPVPPPRSPDKTIKVDLDKPPQKPIRHQHHATLSDGKIIKLQF